MDCFGLRPRNDELPAHQTGLKIFDPYGTNRHHKIEVQNKNDLLISKLITK
jgi:hypothetical protein